MIDKDNIAIGISPDDCRQAISMLGELLFRHGLVKDSFVENALKREEEFPTGLPVGEINVAIPHTDPEHVIQSAIAVGILDKPVDFIAMGSEGTVVPVQLVFLLAVKDSTEQVTMLQRFCLLIQEPGLIDSLVQASDPVDVAQLMNSVLYD